MENAVNNQCPKCGGEMEEGITVDAAHLNAPQEARWAKRLKFGGFLGAENEKKIVTFCCKNCGFLESYAK